MDLISNLLVNPVKDWHEQHRKMPKLSKKIEELSQTKFLSDKENENFKGFLNKNSKLLSCYAHTNPSKWLIFSRRMQYLLRDKDEIVHLLKNLNKHIVKYDKERNDSLFNWIPVDVLACNGIGKTLILSKYTFAEYKNDTFSHISETIRGIFSKYEDIDTMSKVRDIPISYFVHWLNLNQNSMTNLSALGFSETELKIILPHLEWVTLSPCRLYEIDSYVKYLYKVQHLTTPFKTEYLKIFMDLPHLTSLDISHSPISDDDLSHFKSFTKLRRLDLSECPKITAKSIETLKSMIWLEYLDLSYCFSFESKIDELRKSLPNTTIEFSLLRED